MMQSTHTASLLDQGGGFPSGNTDPVDISAMEEMVQRLTSYKGVQGVIISNQDGIAIRSTLSNTTEASKLATLSARMLYQGGVHMKHSVGQDGVVESMRIRSATSEIIIMSSTSGEYPILFTVIQSLS
jgi:predicted regulator of Ras-like GTPase activity (Roadblock/LC7/MglB family)